MTTQAQQIKSKFDNKRSLKTFNIADSEWEGYEFEKIGNNTYQLGDGSVIYRDNELEGSEKWDEPKHMVSYLYTYPNKEYWQEVNKPKKRNIEPFNAWNL